MSFTTQQDIEQFLGEAYEQAPPHIKEFLASGRFGAFLERIRNEQSFHIDTVGAISQEFLMTILGMTEPKELPDRLMREAGLSEEQASVVLEMANEEIFLPLRVALREQQRAEKEVAPVPIPMRAPLVSTPAVGQGSIPSSTPIPGYPPDPTRPTQPAAYVPNGAPLAPIMPPSPQAVPPPVPPRQVPPSPPPMPEPEPYTPQLPPTPVPIPMPEVRTMARDVERFGNPATSTPHITPVRPVPTPAPRAPMPPQASTSVVPAPQAEQTPLTPDIKEVTATLKQYGIDPYRESIE